MSLLTAKFYRPQPIPGVVARPRLQEKLDAGLRRPLTLVAAPAGWGKTTLVAHNLAARLAMSTWLSLDTSDNDPLTLLRYLATAIHRSAPDRVAQTLALLHAAPRHWMRW